MTLLQNQICCICLNENEPCYNFCDQHHIDGGLCKDCRKKIQQCPLCKHAFDLHQILSQDQIDELMYNFPIHKCGDIYLKFIDKYIIYSSIGKNKIQKLIQKEPYLKYNFEDLLNTCSFMYTIQKNLTREQYNEYIKLYQIHNNNTLCQYIEYLSYDDEKKKDFLFKMKNKNYYVQQQFAKLPLNDQEQLKLLFPKEYYLIGCNFYEYFQIFQQFTKDQQKYFIENNIQIVHVKDKFITFYNLSDQEKQFLIKIFKTPDDAIRAVDQYIQYKNLTQEQKDAVGKAADEYIEFQSDNYVDESEYPDMTDENQRLYEIIDNCKFYVEYLALPEDDKKLLQGQQLYQSYFDKFKDFKIDFTPEQQKLICYFDYDYLGYENYLLYQQFFSELTIEQQQEFIQKECHGKLVVESIKDYLNYVKQPIEIKNELKQYKHKLYGGEKVDDDKSNFSYLDALIQFKMLSENDQQFLKQKQFDYLQYLQQFYEFKHNLTEDERQLLLLQCSYNRSVLENMELLKIFQTQLTKEQQEHLKNIIPQDYIRNARAYQTFIKFSPNGQKFIINYCEGKNILNKFEDIVDGYYCYDKLTPDQVIDLKKAYPTEYLENAGDYYDRITYPNVYQIVHHSDNSSFEEKQ